MAILHDREHRTSGFTKFVYFVFVINVLAFLFLIIGALGGWFRIDGERSEDGVYQIGLVFDSGEAGSDIDETVDAASNISETADSASALETFGGEVQSVDAETRRISFVSEGATYDVEVTDATEFEGEGLSDIADIAPGDEVRITMQQTDNKYFAVKVTEAGGLLTP